MPIPGISVMAAVAGGAGGSVVELVAGALSSERNNSNTITWTNLSLGGTANAGDLIVLAFAAYDNDVSDGAYEGNITGFTRHVSRIDTFSFSGAEWTTYIAIYSKVASGGETTVSPSGSFSSFSGTMDQMQVKVFLLRNANSTPLDTASTASTSISIDTNANGVLIGITPESGAATGDVGSITRYTTSIIDIGTEFYRVWTDTAPVGGTATIGTLSDPTVIVSFR